MQQTLSQQRVRVRASQSLTPETPAGGESPAPATPTLAGRFKRIFKNPLVLVAITWVVMAVLLAREILTR